MLHAKLTFIKHEESYYVLLIIMSMCITLKSFYIFGQKDRVAPSAASYVNDILGTTLNGLNHSTHLQ